MQVSKQNGAAWVARWSGRGESRSNVDPNGWTVVDYTERLRSLAVNNARFVEKVDQDRAEHPGLDPKSLALVRIGGLVAVGGAVPSYGELADAAVSAGASTNEIVDVLVGLIPIVGLPCVVAAAPKIALALGYDVEEEELLHQG
jgi:alkylhydroperoxidase/carboxymuconolactone decarboxylase family protein YurZ